MLNRTQISENLFTLAGIGASLDRSAALWDRFWPMGSLTSISGGLQMGSNDIPPQPPPTSAFLIQARMHLAATLLGTALFRRRTITHHEVAAWLENELRVNRFDPDEVADVLRLFDEWPQKTSWVR